MTLPWVCAPCWLWKPRRWVCVSMQLLNQTLPCVLASRPKLQQQLPRQQPQQDRPVVRRRVVAHFAGADVGEEGGGDIEPVKAAEGRWGD